MKLRYLYYSIPLLLWLLQAIYTFHTTNQLRPDEIDPIKDVLPFANRALSSAGGSNVSIYAALLILYETFGFDLYMVKYMRLALELISLFCLSFLLKKYLGEKKAVLPLIIIGLSPTVLFWPTTASSWGMDIQQFPIVLFLIDLFNPKIKWTYFTGLILSWVFAMISWLSYPTFVFYLPFLVWFQIRKLSNLSHLSYLTICLVSFLLPLLLTFIYIERRDILFYDPRYETGLFRAGGKFLLDSDQFAANLAGIFTNLFVDATSFMFEIKVVEFSHILPIATFIFCLILPFKYLKVVGVKPIVFWCFITIILNIILSGLTLDGSGLPGGRRNTPIIVSFYVLLSLSWYLIWKFPTGIKNICLTVIGVLLIHHIIAYPINLEFISQPSPWREQTWYSMEGTPQASVNKLLDTLTKEDLFLDCEKMFPDNCHYLSEYSDIYNILVLSCTYNELNCHQIKGRYHGETEYQTLNYDMFAAVDWFK